MISAISILRQNFLVGLFIDAKQLSDWLNHKDFTFCFPYFAFKMAPHYSVTPPKHPNNSMMVASGFTRFTARPESKL